MGLLVAQKGRTGEGKTLTFLWDHKSSQKGPAAVWRGGGLGLRRGSQDMENK